MNKMRTALRVLCFIAAAWGFLSAVAACFLLSGVPLVEGGSIAAAGLDLDAGSAYAVAGMLFLAASAFSCCVGFFGLRCVRFMRRMDALRASALVGFVAFLLALIACLVIGLLYEVGWMAFVGSAALFAAASLAGEVSRALVAARMRSEAQDV